MNKNLNCILILSKKYKHPQKIMWWAAVTTTGKKISRQLGPNKDMNSENFEVSQDVELLEKELPQDAARQCKATHKCC